MQSMKIDAKDPEEAKKKAIDGCVAAATIAALPVVAATEAPTAESDSDARYRETTHVRDYYRTAKL
jgi:hypothetical protein